MTQVCSICGTSVPAGTNSWCRDCRRRKNREYMRNWRLKNPHAGHAYYESVKDRHKVQMTEWRANNALAVRLSTARYRARKRKAGGEHSPEDVVRQLNSQAGLCYWCGSRLEGRYEVDHFFPVSRGGSNDAENIVVACKPCNRIKHAKQPEDYLHQLIDLKGTRPWI